MSIKQQETRPESQDAVPESPTIQTKPSSAEAGQASPSSSPDEADGSGGADGSRLTALEAELAAAREELAAVNDKYLRKLAEDVNFRKRMTREKEDGQRFAVATLLSDLIPVLDDFDRAVASAEVQKDYTVLHDGVLLIRRQLGSVLEAKYGLARIDSLGKPFDPNHHEAVAIVQGGPEDGEEAVVAEEFLPGYGLHDRILRTAKVRVRMPAPKSSAPDAPAGAAEAPVDSN